MTDVIDDEEINALLAKIENEEELTEEEWAKVEAAPQKSALDTDFNPAD